MPAKVRVICQGADGVVVDMHDSFQEFNNNVVAARIIDSPVRIKPVAGMGVIDNR